MNILILASFLILSLVISIGIKSSNKKIATSTEEYLEKERKANFVRKKPLDNLNYIIIPDTFYTYDYSSLDDPASRVQDAVYTLNQLKDAKIVNFNGISNTDLKLEYGTANITVLTEYDQNYILLARTLQTLAENLYNAGFVNETVSILEFAVSTGTDVSGSYKLLADIYVERHDSDAFASLTTSAESLTSVMRGTIIRYLDSVREKL